MRLDGTEYDEYSLGNDLLLNIKENSTDDIKNMCVDYWTFKIDSKNKITYTKSVADIAYERNTTKETLRKKVQEHAFVYDLTAKCNGCGEYIPQGMKKNRNDLGYYKRSSVYYNKCYDCEKLDKQKKKKESEEYNKKWEEKQNQVYKEKVLEHIEAIKNGIYESLLPMELNYLVFLAKIGDSIEVAKIMGISEKKRVSLHKTMGDLKLIVFPPSGGYFMDDKFKKSLCKLNTDDKLKSVFGSKAAHDLYKKLRRTYLYVYPEVPLAAFIKKQDVEHIFTEQWHSNYFLMCRLDFVVTDQHGMPRFGVEYQGGYHESTEQTVKDEFKLKLMNELGLEIQYKTHLDLKDD